MAIDSTSNAPHMVAVHAFRSEPEGEALEALLRENGINVRIIRQSHDSAFDGLMLNQEGGDAIFVPEEDLDKSRLLIEEYLQSIPTGDDAETLQWKRDLASKRLRVNVGVTWIFSPCLVALGLWLIIRGNGLSAELYGWTAVALAIIFFWSMRARRRADQKTVSEFDRKPD